MQNFVCFERTTFEVFTTHKVDVITNFVFPYIYIYIYLQSLVNVKLDIIRGLHFKVSDFTGLVSWQY